MVKNWHQHFLVAYVKVRVTRRQPFIFVTDNFGHGQLYNFEFFAVLVNCLTENVIVFFEGIVIDVVLVVLISANNGGWVYEPG